MPVLRKPSRRPLRGLTLLELLLVIAILAALALSAVAIVNQADEQFRFEDTRRRLTQIKHAITGDTETTANGQPLITGFVADVGRLPRNLEELLIQGDLPGYAFDNDRQQWSGWRGPYLNAEPQIGGTASFPDGWSNTFDILPPAEQNPLNYGWQFAVKQVEVQSVPSGGVNDDPLPDASLPGEGELFVQSVGADRRSGTLDTTNDYQQDYPSDFLLRREDHHVNVANWRVYVRFRKQGTGADPDLTDVRLRLIFPHVNAAGGVEWPEDAVPTSDVQQDVAVYLSLAHDGLGAFDADGTKIVEFNFGDVAANTGKWIPAGVRTMAVVESDGDTLFQASLNTPQSFVLVPRAAPPVSSQTAPLLSWDVAITP